jgi:hypothetical protein
MNREYGYHDACLIDGIQGRGRKLTENIKEPVITHRELGTNYVTYPSKKLHSILYTIEPVRVLRKLFMAGAV